MAAALVSFVVPVYNYGRFVKECLDSIFALEGGYSFEVIAIDDASTDESLEILRSISDPRLRVITHETNAGHVATMEEGLGATKGKYVARLDPDDRYRPNFLTSTVPMLEQHLEVALVYGDVAQIDAEGLVTVGSSDMRHGGRDFRGNEFVRLLGENFIAAPSVLGRREAWLEALPIPQDLAFNDWWFTLQIARRHDVYCVADVIAEYRVHDKNHHMKIVSNGSEERSVFWLLDRIFDERESSDALEKEKQAAKKDIMARQYLTLARKYFGLGMYRDARRCYLSSARNRPRNLTRPDVLRQLLATFLGQERYARIKSTVRRGKKAPQGR